jgi:hypothetical protein
LKLARFPEHVVSLAPEAVVGNAKHAVQCGDGGYADWVIVSIHGLKTYPDLPYRRYPDVLYELPRIARILDLEPVELPDFSTVCTHVRYLTLALWRASRQLSAQLQDTREIQAIDATGMDRIAASRRYATRTNYTFKAVKTTAVGDCKTDISSIYIP